jgi:hypothetical protein
MRTDVLGFLEGVKEMFVDWGGSEGAPFQAPREAVRSPLFPSDDAADSRVWVYSPRLEPSYTAPKSIKTNGDAAPGRMEDVGQNGDGTEAAR